MNRPPRRKGGKIHPDAFDPARALEAARRAEAEGILTVDDRVYDQLSAMGIPLQNAREAIRTALQEVVPDHYKCPDEEWRPPGHGFIWYSESFASQMYIKIRLEGPRPRCKLYSLHEPKYKVAELQNTREGGSAPPTAASDK